MLLAKAKRLKNQAPLGATLVIFSSLFYASYGIWTKLIGNFMGGYTASAIRSVLVLAILAPTAWALHKLEPINLKQNRKFLLGLVVSSLFSWGPFYFAILHAGVAVGLAINYASIIIGTFVVAWLFAGERFTKDKLAATLLSFVGIWLVFTPNLAGVGWLALASAIVSGFSMGANGVFAKLLNYNATQPTLASWVASAISNTVMALILTETRPAVGLHIQWLYLLGFVLASIASSWSFVAGLKRIEAGAAGILGLMEIVFGVLFGIVLFGEHLGLISVLGVGLIIASAAIPYVKEYRAKQLA
jgi:drug/metabolite transporter (DMT)-like permease